ncbi:hypothetical protein V2I01_27740 [Micromonospora sp. BRA006-A]|nr:hypothetical protein [Micromonospora sp. BRA006-A]
MVLAIATLTGDPQDGRADGFGSNPIWLARALGVRSSLSPALPAEAGGGLVGGGSGGAARPRPVRDRPRGRSWPPWSPSSFWCWRGSASSSGGVGASGSAWA